MWRALSFGSLTSDSSCQTVRSRSIILVLSFVILEGTIEDPNIVSREFLVKAFCSCCLMDLSAREQNSTIINRTSSYVILKENPPLIYTKKAIVPNAFLRRIDSSDSNTGAFYTRVHQHLRRYIYVYFKVYHQAITFFILKQQHYGPSLFPGGLPFAT